MSPHAACAACRLVRLAFYHRIKETLPEPFWGLLGPEPMVDDMTAVKPKGWQDDEPALVDDPKAAKPSDWDDEEDGDWEPSQIPNPKCKVCRAACIGVLHRVPGHALVAPGWWCCSCHILWLSAAQLVAQASSRPDHPPMLSAQRVIPQVLAGAQR